MPDPTMPHLGDGGGTEQNFERTTFRQRAIEVLHNLDKIGVSETSARQILTMPREGLLALNRGEVTAVYEDGMLPVVQYLLKYGNSKEARSELERELAGELIRENNT